MVRYIGASWAFIGFAVAIVLTAIMLLFDGQFVGADSDKPAAIGWFGRGAVWLVIALVALNVISTLLECGFSACPDNPVPYHLLKLPPKSVTIGDLRILHIA